MITSQTIFVVPILLASVYTDLRTGKIKNKLIFSAMISGCLLNYVTGGLAAMASGIKMAAITIAFLYVLFLIGGLGAGDIKLLALIGLLFPDNVILITVLSFLIAGGIAFIRIVGRIIRREKAIVKGETMHFSVPIVMAFVLEVLLKGIR